jgi:predicted Zn-dependent peptidase
VLFREHMLDNGLEIVAECNPRAYSMALGIFVRAGSRDESDENHGVSHFLEHMAFKGTPTRSAADVNRELDEIGSHSNAYTSEEQTVYFAAILPEYQDRALELLTDIMRPSLRQSDFEMEKKVILEEIAKYEDQPPFGAHEKCMAAHFEGHPLARNVLGSTASVASLSRQTMLDYFRSRYSPNNMVLAAAGNVDFDRLVALADRLCGSWQIQDAPREISPAAPNRGLQVVWKPMAAQQYVIQIANGPALEDTDRYAGRILATVLGDDSGSRMFWELVDTGGAECASMSAYEYLGTGLFMTYLCCAPEDTGPNLEKIGRIVRDAEQRGIAADELRQAQSKIRSHIVLQSERPSNRLFAVGTNWASQREYRTVREVTDNYDRVTVADVARLLEQYPLSDPTTVAVGPLERVDQLAADSA